MEKVSERDALVKALEEWRDPTTNKLLSLAGRKSLVTLFAAQQSEREKAMADVLSLVLLFHRGGWWTQDDIGEWLRITGKTDATTKVMCDTIRAALAIPPGA